MVRNDTGHNSRNRRIPLCLTFLAVLLTGLRASAASIDSYKVVAKFPHSIESYTEGFFYLDGMFYEGTGRNGHSAVMALDPNTGNTIARRDLPPEYFGEGIVDWAPTFSSGHGNRTSVSSTTDSHSNRSRNLLSPVRDGA
jgi:glutamine cyclotransferase